MNSRPGRPLPGKAGVRVLQGKKAYRPKKPKPVAINRKSVVLLDEAGMINTRHMKMLMEWARDNNATLVLTGDAAQLAAVEGGSPFLSISKRIGFSEMADIKRQNDYWAREASYYLATGQIAKAMSYYERRGNSSHWGYSLFCLSDREMSAASSTYLHWQAFVTLGRVLMHLIGGPKL